MMHYRKGENVEKKLTREELPFEDFLAKNTEFLWMHVNGGTNVNNVIAYAKNALEKGEYKHIIWSGNGGGVVKTVSCAEILKRSYPLYQVTRMCYTTVEEYWKPQMEGLEEIVANRQIPSLHIFMSLDPIDDKVMGLQKPNTKTDFWVDNYNQNTATTSTNKNIHHKSGNQGQRRPKPNHSNTTRNEFNNEQPANDVATSSSSKHQGKYNNKQKRKRSFNGCATQNPSKTSDNNDQMESMHT